ncbi:MAG: Mpo1 family 2-hydroxy fatty acid dioxygenase [Pseudomarimonas sp.]
MNATYTDQRRPVDQYLGNYSEDHRNPTNQIIHWLCVPVIVWSVVAGLWVIPVPAGLGTPGLWAGLSLVAAMGFYLRLSRPLALAMLVVLAGLMWLTHWMYGVLGAQTLLWSAVIVFVVAWIVQFIGHEIEGKRPSFLTDLSYLLIGPLWLLSKLFRRAGLSY